MTTVTLGSTGITVPKNGFGALPIQRTGREEAVRLLRRACEGGIRFFDTARAYSDSEEKLGAAFAGMRDKLFIATKAPRFTVEAFWEDLQTSLRLLGTEYVDLYQFHNPDFCPRPGDGTGLYEAMLEAKAQGKVRHIGITNHRLAVAREAVDSGLYATLQFPYSYLSGPQEQELVEMCERAGMGFVAMKGMAGGLLRDGIAAAAFMALQPIVVPIWGVQHEWELDQFLSCVADAPAMTEERLALIEKDRAELTGSFCRSCGYCMPCPVGIQINQCARMSLMLRRMPAADYLTEYWQGEMKKVEDCLHCGKCASKCPYGLNPPQMLQDNYKEYWTHF